ncbi:unnamed protein product [Heligmosomoides polygyrus]|uniref:Eukaryotic translation initiation factor 3 subunit K n=1 Tax=Heligmosomoides polygyrus TaxID=6339 RepID=A0A3P7YUG4_HELPZ|nr:unnamed protein product [Heligmosomoides polygyrus]
MCFSSLRKRQQNHCFHCRYNPENVGDLARCVQAMATENQYDRDIVLTILKLYQLNPDKYDESIVRLVLLKTLMVLPGSDFALAKCLIDSNRLGSQELKRVLDLGSVLEACDFAVFWELMRGEYKPSTDVTEPFKVPQEVPRMVKSVAGFEEAVRVCTYASQLTTLVHIHYRCLPKIGSKSIVGWRNRFVLVHHFLICICMQNCISDKQIAEYVKRFGWEERPDNVFFIANHEATIRTRNIDEKLQFTSTSQTICSITT